MADYEFVTTWRIPAPAQFVWDEIHDVEHWPDWWKAVEHVDTLEAGDQIGLGGLRRIVWRGPLPYRITIDVRVTRIAQPTMLEGVATGDLTGWGCWQLTSEGRSTIVRFDWRVDATRRWMRVLAPHLRPAVRWNHDAVMRAGYKGLLRRLQKELVH
ncbi:MAG: SRPBCC family protein [Rhodothermales bacterium]|nr:SRPBCC family protein [Rhodothermales bacterium]